MTETERQKLLTEVEKNREQILVALQDRMSKGVTFFDIALYAGSFAVQLFFKVRFNLANAFKSAIGNEIFNIIIGGILGGGGVNTAWGGEELPSWRYNRCLDRYIDEKTHTQFFPFRSIFIGRTHKACFDSIKYILLANKEGLDYPNYLYKTVFQKNELSREEYLINLVTVLMQYYPVINEKDRDNRIAYKMLLGGPILHTLFKNQNINYIGKREKNPSSKNTQTDRARWYNMFKELYGVFSYEDNKLWYEPILAVNPELEALKYVIYKWEKEAETFNPIMAQIESNFKEKGYNGWVGLALAYLLFYHVCIINFQLYLDNKIKWEDYVNNCFKLIDDLLESRISNLNISNYINKEKFLKAYPNYPIKDVLKLNYKYIKDNWNYIVINMHQTITALNFYFPDHTDIVTVSLNTKPELNISNFNKAISKLKTKSSQIWYYIIPTMGLLIGTIFILIKIYKTKKYRR